MAASWRRRKGKEGIGRRDASAIGARVSLTRLVLFHAIPPTERAKLRDADELASPTVLWTSVWSKPHSSSTHPARPEVKKKLPHRTVTVKSGAKNSLLDRIGWLSSVSRGNGGRRRVP